MTDPRLDFRSSDQFYQQALSLAEAYCPDWSKYWPADQDSAVSTDMGLVLLKLFSLLASYLADMENQVPNQRRLALFQFLGLLLRPPVEARAPLTFLLQRGQPPRPVPAETAVLNAPTQDLRFQTDADLLVVPATMNAALTILPAQDQYINALPALTVGQAVPVFPAADSDPAERPLPHWFMMGDPALFKPDPALQELTITLTGSHLLPEYFQQWFDGDLAPLGAVMRGSGDGLRLEISLSAMPAAAARSVAQVQAELYARAGRNGGFTADLMAEADPTPLYWLLVCPAPLIRVVAALSRQLPVITGASCGFAGGTIPVQTAMANLVQVNINNGAYPFGETPATEDSFYIRSDSLFSRQGARIALNFDLRTVSADYPVMLTWQYWDGGAWLSLNATATDRATHQFEDTTDQLRRNAAQGPTWVRFLCPAMAPATVAGETGLWVRVVIAEGGYGIIGAITTQGVDQAINAIPDTVLPAALKPEVITYLNNTEGVNFSYTYTPSTYAPPYIRSLSLSYTYTSRASQFWTYNSFTLSRFRFSPYKPVELAYSSFFLGFDPGGFAQYTTGQPLRLYVQMAEESQAPQPALEWWWFDGATWCALSVDDSTDGLTRSGIVGFTVPAAMIAATLYSETAFWFRVDNPNPSQRAVLRGLYPNSVMAGNRTTIIDEVLGSSIERPSQSFQLSHVPVLAGLNLVVLEPATMARSDQGASSTTSLLDSLAGEASGNQAGTAESVAQVPIQWTQVDNFAFSGPASRHYTLDSQNGLITFGDGRNGMVPPAGHNNIVAASYASTNGLAGNVEAGILTVLKPGISDIQQVFNPVAAQGGVDGDTVAQLNRQGPGLVKANDQAVQIEDFATLATAASPRVARARARTTDRGGIAVAVLPRAATARPYADPALLDLVSTALRQRCLAPLAGRISVSGPDYVAMEVSVQVYASVTADRRNAVQAEMEAQLQSFFQPVLGGPDGLGWAFGQTVEAAMVVRLLYLDPRVTSVAAISLNGHFDGSVALAPNQLPVAGAMTVLVFTA